VDLRHTSHLINALSDQTDNSPANRERDREALLWGRAAKVSEEAGEVIEALIGALGHSPRKGVHGTLDDVEYELLDVALAALCSVSHLYSRRGETPDPLRLLGLHAESVARRAGLIDGP
jgi:NTP pyrophosphatase (non-canonical NTP hydrolase)